MRAAPADQLRLLDLQQVDTGLDQLAHRRRTLPELAEIDRLTTEQRAQRDDVVRAETEVSDLGREQRKLEADVDQVCARAERDQQRMRISTSAKEAESLQHEVTSLSRRQSDLEDQVLELMERREESDGRLSAATTRLTCSVSGYEVAVSGRDEAFAQIDADVSEQQDVRAAIAAELPAELLAHYERMRTSSGGTGAARLFRRRCEGCHLELSGGDLQRVRAAAEDEVLHCEECGRILVRTAESAL